MRRVIVLHEYGANNHYSGLELLARTNGFFLDYFEFSFIRQIIKGIVRFDIYSLNKGMRNLFFFISSLLTGLKGENVVVGIAPYDYRVIFILLLTRNANYFLHTSWPYWFDGYTPKKEIKILRCIWRRFVLNSKAIFAVTDAVKTNLCKGYNYPKNKCHVVYHACGKHFFSENIKSDEVKKNKKISAVYVGRYDKSKGLDTIFELAEEHNDVDFHFIGYGSVIFPKRENIFNHGRIDDKNKLKKVMAEHDLLLLPSKKVGNWQEVFGIVIIEGLAVGLYPIVTSQIGPSELIDKTLGICFSEDRYKDGFTSVLNELKEITETELVNIKARAKIKSKAFTVEQISKRWSDILRYTS